MSVEDRRRPPFSWVGTDALARIRSVLPERQQAAARNTLLAMAEAASIRRDGHHRDGDTLRALAALAGVSERRLRDQLQVLETIGLVRSEAVVDAVGRSLPTRYVLLDTPGADVLSDPDVLSDRADVSADVLSAPKRAIDLNGKKEEAVVSPVVDGRARTVPIPSLAEEIRGVLQRGLDGLTTSEPCRWPTVAEIQATLDAHPRPELTARAAAVEARSVAQSQNRAPNIAGLFAQRLAAAPAAEAA